MFEPRISRSQVICAIGKEKIEYYQNFFRVENISKRNSNFQNTLSSDFIWETRLDDDIYIWNKNYLLQEVVMKQKKIMITA